MAKAEATVEELVGMIERDKLGLPEMHQDTVARVIDALAPMIALFRASAITITRKASGFGFTRFDFVARSRGAAVIRPHPPGMKETRPHKPFGCDRTA